MPKHPAKQTMKFGTAIKYSIRQLEYLKRHITDKRLPVIKARVVGRRYEEVKFDIITQRR